MGAALLWGMLLAAPTGNKPASEGLARRQVQRDETHFDAHVPHHFKLVAERTDGIEIDTALPVHLKGLPAQLQQDSLIRRLRQWD